MWNNKALPLSLTLKEKTMQSGPKTLTQDLELELLEEKTCLGIGKNLATWTVITQEIIATNNR